MWLPKDERRLLAGYYRCIEEPGSEEVYEVSELIKLLPWKQLAIRSYSETGGGDADFSGEQPDVQRMKQEIASYIRASRRVKLANDLLQRRDLISAVPHETAGDVFVIELTLEGYDLGRRYHHWWWRSGLWFNEIRNHWIWLIVSFFGGAMGAFVFDWLREAARSSG